MKREHFVKVVEEALELGVSRLLCKRPGFVFGDGVPGKGAVPLPRHRFRSSPVFIA
jgi:hypothetical protein